MAVEQTQPSFPPAGVRPESGQAVGQKPSLGRIVLYRHNLYEDENGCAPAIVTGVSDDWPQNTVDLVVFFKNQVPYPIQGIAEGPEQGQWLWPPRV